MADTALEDLGIQNLGSKGLEQFFRRWKANKRRPAAVCHTGICRVPKSMAATAAFSFHQTSQKCYDSLSGARGCQYDCEGCAYIQIFGV